MGIIQRQSVKGIIIFVIGSGIHFITMLLLMPNILSEADQAIYRVYASLIALFSVAGVLGINGIVLKHVNDFEKKPEQKKAFNFVTLLIASAGAIGTVLVIFLSKTLIYYWKHNDSPMLLQYFWCVPVSVFFYVFIYYFEFYSIATHRLTAPAIVKEILLRGTLLLSVVLIYFKIIDIKMFFVLYACSHCVAAIILAIYCILIRGFKIGFNKSIFKQINFKQYLPYTIFIFFTGLLASLILNLDQPVVYSMLGARATDIYGLAVTTAAMITIPYKPLSSLLLPFMFDAWKNNDIEKLNEINKQSSINLSILGSLFFVLLVANVPNLLPFIPAYFAALKWPLIIIGIGRLLDYTTGTSSELLLSAPTHKNLIGYMIITFLVSLICYKLLIPRFHEIGAALSCSITLVVFNILKYRDLYKNYKLQPVSIVSFYSIALGLIILFLQSFIPQIGNSFIDAFIRSSIIAIIYLSTIWKMKWTPLMNDMIEKKVGKLIKK
jgi:O-antigen/teichoic acid export membrane protein